MLHSSMDNAKNETTRSEESSAPVRMARLAASPGARIATGAADGPAARQTEMQHRVFSQAHSIYGNQAVLRMLDRATNSSMPILQRKCACEGSGTNCATCNEKKESVLERKAGHHAEPDRVPHIVHEVLSSSGNPLDANTRAFMEPRFGHDLGGVRIHTDSKAAESARAVNALAYTVGRNVVFGAGQYLPTTDFGKRLIAHELTHVVQQGQTAGRVAYRQADEAANTAGQPVSATDKLLNVVGDMEKVRSFGSQKLPALADPLEPAQGAKDDQAQAGAQDLLDTVSQNIERVRAVAQGNDEAMKLSVLSAFTPQRLAAADNQLGVVPREANAPQGAPAADVQEKRPEEVATFSMEVSSPQDAAEVEADRISAAVVSGDSVRIGPTKPRAMMHRQVGEALVAAGSGLLVTDAELSPVEAATGPPGWAVAAGLAVTGVALIGIGYLLTRARTCPPCPAPPGPEIHRDHTHYPCTDHWHYFRYNQNPQTCQCFLQRLFGGCCGVPGAPC